MNSIMLDTLRSAEQLARERNQELIAQEIRVAIALAEVEVKTKMCTEPEYETEEEKRWQDEYKKVINEDYWGLCNHIDKGDYHSAMAALERHNYDFRFLRSLRTWSVFGMIVALLLEMEVSLFVTAFVSLSAFLVSWVFFCRYGYLCG